jgi:hypothetical protein
MKLSRPSRIAAALVAMICVLFTQLAVAAYVCPGMEIARAVEAAAMPMGHDCEGMDMEQPTLCHEHAQIGKQSLDKPPLPNLSPAVAILLVPAIRDIRVVHRADTGYADLSWLVRTAAPPLSIQNCCFRI